MNESISVFRIMRQFLDILLNNGRLASAILVLTSFVCIPYLITNLQPNNEISIWFSDDDPALLRYYSFQEKFGNDRVMSVVYDRAERVDSLFAAGIVDLIRSIEEIDGVNQAMSLYNAKDFQRMKDGNRVSINFSSYFDGSNLRNPQTEIEQVYESPLINNRFISRNRRVGLILVQFEPNQYFDQNRNRVIAEVIKISEEKLGKDHSHFGGLEMVTYGLNKLSQKDFVRFTGGCFLVLFLAVLAYYRSFLYLLYVVATCLTAVIITFTIYSLFGLKLNLFTIIIPALIITLGLMTVLHIINQYRLHENLANLSDNKLRVKKTLESVLKPCLFTTITTMIGFLSLLTSSTSVLKEFGIFGALGIAITFICAITYGTVFLTWKTTDGGSRPGLVLGRFLGKAMELMLRKKLFPVLTVLFVTIVSIVGLFRINVDLFPMSYFPEDYDVVRDHEYIEEHWGEYIPIDLVLRSRDSSSLVTYGRVSRIRDFEEAVHNHPKVKQTISQLQVAERFSQVAYGRDLENVLRRPIMARTFIKRMVNTLEKDSVQLGENDFTEARYTLIGPTLSVNELESAIAEIHEIGKTHLGEDILLEVAGYPSLFVNVMNYAFTSMRDSLAVAIVLIFLAMLALLKSLRLAIIALLPNLFPLFIVMGFLGWAGINLDLATATVAAIALGVAIDDSIHFLHRYVIAKKQGRTTHEALIIAQQEIGRIIVISSLFLILGFSVLLLASLKTAVYFGLLIIVAVLAALIGDLVILPLLLQRFSKGSN